MIAFAWSAVCGFLAYSYGMKCFVAFVLGGLHLLVWQALRVLDKELAKAPEVE